MERTLADFTSPALIIPELHLGAATEAIALLCCLLHQEGGVRDSAAFCGAVMAREFLSPTSLPPGWALPHARLQSITQLSFALARSAQPLVWCAESSIRPQIVFLFAVPESEAKTYLRVVSAVAKLSQNEFLFEQLRTAPDAHAMLEVLGQVPLRIRGLPPAVSASIR